MYPRRKAKVRTALRKIAQHLYSNRRLARVAVATCGSSRTSTDRCPVRIKFGGLTAHDFTSPRCAHHRLRVFPRRQFRHRTARFALSRRNSASWHKNVPSSACAFPADRRISIATVASGGPCPIPRGNHHHQITIASTRGPRVRATRFLQRLPMAQAWPRSRCRASQKPHNCASYFLWLY
jgi:hypothetical protein